MAGNIFSNIDAIGGISLGNDDLYEKRIDYAGGPNAVYIAYSPVPNAATDDAVWYIVKNYYDGSNNLIRVQVPDNGPKFAYTYDNRATYFS